MNFDLSSFWDLPLATKLALLALTVINFLALGVTLKLVGKLVRNRRSANTLAIITIVGVFLFGWVLPHEALSELGMMARTHIARPFYIARQWDMENGAVRIETLVELAGYAALNIAALSSFSLLVSRSKRAVALACILGVLLAAASATLGIIAKWAPANFG